MLVVRAQMTFEVHVGPFRCAPCALGLEFKAGLFIVLRGMEHEMAVGQAIAANTEPFVGEPDSLLLMGVLPYDLPPHLLQPRAVELNQQPRRRTGPATFLPVGVFPRAV